MRKWHRTGALVYFFFLEDSCQAVCTQNLCLFRDDFYSIDSIIDLNWNFKRIFFFMCVSVYTYLINEIHCALHKHKHGPKHKHRHMHRHTQYLYANFWIDIRTFKSQKFPDLYTCIPYILIHRLYRTFVGGVWNCKSILEGTKFEYFLASENFHPKFLALENDFPLGLFWSGWSVRIHTYYWSEVKWSGVEWSGGYIT